MSEKNYEINDDELDDVAGGIDLGAINSKNIGKFIKAIIAGDSTTCIALIQELMAAGTDAGAIEQLIEKFSKSEQFKSIIKSFVK